MVHINRKTIQINISKNNYFVKVKQHVNYNQKKISIKYLFKG